MTPQDLDTLRALMATSLTAAGLATFVAVLMYGRDPTYEDTYHETYWTVLRRVVIALIPSLVALFLLVTLWSFWVVSTWVDHGAFPSLANSSYPLFHPTDQNFGALHHPKAILPLLAEVGFSTAIWTLGLTISYLSYLIYHFHPTAMQKPVPQPPTRFLDHAGFMPEKFIVPFLHFLALVSSRLYKYAFVRWPFQVLALSAVIVTVLAILSETTLDLPELTTTIILVPFVFGFAIVLGTAEATGLVGYLKTVELAIGIYMLRVTKVKDLPVLEVLVMGYDGPVEKHSCLPGQRPGRHLCLPAIYAEAKEIGEGQTHHPLIKTRFKQIFPGSSFALGRLIADDIEVDESVNCRVVSYRIHPEDYSLPPQTGRWMSLEAASNDPDAHPHLKKALQQDLPNARPL